LRGAHFNNWSALALGLWLTACASVDQFGSRIYDGNLNSQNATNQEILLNIIRASRYQSTNFLAITQVTGGQSELLTTGLPTITFGPAQTATQHQAVISNSLASGVTGGYQSNPLVSSAFSEGMLSPISLRTIALLLGSHPREAVFYATIDSIRLKLLGRVDTYRNDPSYDTPPNGQALSCHNMFEVAAEREDVSFFKTREDVCNYTKFASFLLKFLDFGLYAELVPANPTASKAGTPTSAAANTTPSTTNTQSTNATASPQATGQLCFDPSHAELEDYRRELLGSKFKQAVCKVHTSASKARPTNQAGNLIIPFTGIGNVELDAVTFRSPSGVFQYLGTVWRNDESYLIHYGTREAQALLQPSVPYINIIQGNSDCFVALRFHGAQYCVPQGSDNTALLMDILVQLRNLSITPSDLNSAFSVRVID
jgi:hypothetical protein